MRSRAPRSTLVAALTVLLAAPVGTQAPPSGRPQSDQSEQSVPTFRASVRYVEIDVDVKVGGQFLAGLTKDDFELFEDRKPQVIDNVTFVDIPVITEEVQSAEPVASSRLDSLNQTGRIYAMVFGIYRDQQGAEGHKKLARKFIREYLAPGDLLAIVYVNQLRGQGLTSDKEKLLAAVDRPDPTFTPPSDPFLFSSRYRTPTDREDQFMRLYRTLKEVAVSLGSITGRRKSIILVSEGEDLWPQAPPPTQSGQSAQMGPPRYEAIHDRWAYLRDATRTAAAFNVPIHTIRPRGSNLGDPMVLTFPDSGDESGRRLLSEDTNGVDLGTINSADKGFRAVVARNTRYYILGYYSTLEQDGREHPITVRVKRKGAEVNARRGVRTLRPIRMPDAVKLPRALAPAAREVLLGKDVAATLPIDASVEIFQGVDFKAALLVEAVVGGLNLDLSPGRKLEFSVAAVDPQGIIRAFDRRAFALNVRDDTRQRLGRDPLTFFTRLELPPGQYTVRVSAHQPGGATGFQSREIQIPDFAERALTISNVLIASASRSALVLQPDDTIRRALRGAPTLERRFSTSETLSVFGEIYDSHWPLASELTAAWTVAREDTITTRGESTIEVERGGVGYFRGEIPLATLGPGDYVLEVEVRSTVGPPATARSSMPFQVFREP